MISEIRVLAEEKLSSLSDLVTDAELEVLILHAMLEIAGDIELPHNMVDVIRSQLIRFSDNSRDSSVSRAPH